MISLKENDESYWVTPQKSMFRTHIPRPLNIISYLLITGVTFLVALALAVFFAER